MWSCLHENGNKMINNKTIHCLTIKVRPPRLHTWLRGDNLPEKDQGPETRGNLWWTDKQTKILPSLVLRTRVVKKTSAHFCIRFLFSWLRRKSFHSVTWDQDNLLVVLANILICVYSFWLLSAVLCHSGKKSTNVKNQMIRNAPWQTPWYRIQAKYQLWSTYEVAKASYCCDLCWVFGAFSKEIVPSSLFRFQLEFWQCF